MAEDRAAVAVADVMQSHPGLLVSRRTRTVAEALAFVATIRRVTREAVREALPHMETEVELGELCIRPSMWRVCRVGSEDHRPRKPNAGPLVQNDP